MIKIIITSILSSLSCCALAQIDSSNTTLPQQVARSPLTISGYAEIYYSYDLSNPSNHTRPGFVYSYNRHNEVNLNLGFIKAAYQTAFVRANLAIMTGTYANANMINEPGVLKNIFEANAGVKLSKKKNLWVDAGIFTSHIGFESAVGKDCWTLTRSIMADNSPYYESGVKLGYKSDNGKWFLSVLYLNGWQHIQRPDNYNTPAFGHQLTYTPNSKVTLNSSSFIGSNTPDSTNRMRYFHNLYGIFQVRPRIGITAGFDIGAQQTNKNSSNYYVWYTPVLILKIKATDKISIVARGEYYYDENGIVIVTGTVNGFQTFGYSLNLDYAIKDNIVWRIEGRTLNSKDKIFSMDNKASHSNYTFTTALAISF
jgi:hypothetical protein